MKKRKWGFAGRGSISPRNHSALSKKGGQARAKKLSRRKLSAIGKRGGRPGTVRERAKQLGVKIPRGASRQYASKLVKRAEAQLKKEDRRAWAFMFGPGVGKPTGILLAAAQSYQVCATKEKVRRSAHK